MYSVRVVHELHSRAMLTHNSQNPPENVVEDCMKEVDEVVRSGPPPSLFILSLTFYPESFVQAAPSST